jgi:protein-S-isoprenylcysteine O-methyltransferase Ste14
MEEQTLIDIFGEKYIDFAVKTPIRLPFVKGYQVIEEAKLEN